MEFDLLTLMVFVFVIPASFVLSSAAGFGGSLILVPALAMVLGVKEGVALAALLLAVNNLVKLGAYRKTLPIGASATMMIAVMLGSVLGASLLLQAPESWVKVAVLAAFVATLLVDALPVGFARKSWAATLAFTSGATSGFSGMSGPLKGVALRSLGLERQFFVGAASLVSLIGDTTKAMVFIQGDLLGKTELIQAGVLIPVMIVATFFGRYLNRRIGEQGFAVLFWMVIVAYTSRLILST